MNKIVLLSVAILVGSIAFVPTASAGHCVEGVVGDVMCIVFHDVWDLAFGAYDLASCFLLGTHC